MNNFYWELLFNFRWPHEGFSIGWDIFNPDEINDYTTVRIYLGFLTIIINWGEDDEYYI